MKELITTYFSLSDQIKCVERELDMRRKVYPARIAAGKMTPGTAQHETAAMEAVLQTLKEKQRVDSDRIVFEIREELAAARAKFPDKFHSMHEGYAVILEELDEAWDQIKRDNHPATLEEMVQVGAMVLRFLEDFAIPVSTEMPF